MVAYLAIPDLPASVALNGTEQVEGVQSGASVRITLNQIGSFIQATYPLQVAALTIGTTQVLSAADSTLLYNNAGKLGAVALATLLLAGSNITVSVAGADPAQATIAAFTATQSANRLFAGPSSGVPAAPTFRLQVLADLPSIANQTLLSNISGGPSTPSASTLSAILDNVLSSTQGSILYRGASVWSALGPGTSGNFLQTLGAGANPQWQSVTSSITVGTTTIAGGTSGRVLYDNAGVLGEYVISGSGSVAMTTSPVFTTPTLGVASATTINKVTITAPATGSTLTIADGKTFTVSNTLTLTATDGSTLAIGAGGTLVASAFTDTTNASNISSGTLPAGRLTGSYTGITGVGTLTAGTWTASVIGATYGGTGVNNGSNTLTLAASLVTTGAGAPTLAFPGSAQTYTFQAANDTVVMRGTTDTLTNKTLTSVKISGAGAGLSTVQYANSAANTTLTIPATTGTVITSGDSGTVTNAMLANSTITLNAGANVGLTTPGAMSLGSTYTIGATTDTPRFAGLGLGGAATGANILTIFGATSGHIDVKTAAVAGTNTLTLPAGTTDFSATGGASQVVKQTTSGGAFTVAQLAASDLSNGTTGSGAVVLAGSPALTGTPTAPTASAADNSTKIATTAYVDAAAGSAPATWTPTDASGAGLSLTTNCKFFTTANEVVCYGQIAYPNTADGTGAAITLPVAVPNQAYAIVPSVIYTGGANVGATVGLITNQNASSAKFVSLTANSGAALGNSVFSNATLHVFLRYPKA